MTDNPKFVFDIGDNEMLSCPSNIDHFSKPTPIDPSKPSPWEWFTEITTTDEPDDPLLDTAWKEVLARFPDLPPEIIPIAVELQYKLLLGEGKVDIVHGHKCHSLEGASLDTITFDGHHLSYTLKYTKITTKEEP